MVETPIHFQSLFLFLKVFKHLSSTKEVTGSFCGKGQRGKEHKNRTEIEEAVMKATLFLYNFRTKLFPLSCCFAPFSKRTASHNIRVDYQVDAGVCSRYKFNCYGGKQSEPLPQLSNKSLLPI